MLELRECHIQPDWLLIYRAHEEELTLIAQRTKSQRHSLLSIAASLVI